MECYICGYCLPEGVSVCPNCGRRCSAQVPECPVPVGCEPEPPVPAEAPVCAPEESCLQPAAEVPAAQPVRRSRPLLIPTLVLCGMFLLGLICFFLIPMVSTGSPTATDPQIQGSSLPDHVPNDKTEHVPSETHAYDPTDEDCFELTGGAVRFLPNKFDGGSILVIPDEIDGKAVTSIADYGFANCDGITTIILPNTLKSIGSFAFNGCDDLRGIYLPESLQEVGSGAFNWCISLESVWVSAGVESIGSGAFTGCASLMYFFYDGTYEAWLELYNEYVTPFTYVTCTDGDYYHGVNMP